MKKLVMGLLCFSTACVFIACGNSVQQNSKDDSALVKVINASSEEIYGIGYDYYVDGDLVSSGGGCYADNSAIKIGDKFSLERQPSWEASEDIEIEISVVDKSGKEYPCSSRISLDTENGTGCVVEVTGDFENGFCASVGAGK